MKKDILVFAIPVMPKCRSANWSEVESNLANTVNSILGSSDPRVLAVIAHHEKPSGAYWSDSRVISVDLGNSEIPEGKIDKRQKRKAVGSWLRYNGYDGVYVMFLDADDLVNVNLSSYVLRNNNVQGFWVSHGYNFDYENLIGVPCFSRFNQICGSCFIGLYSNFEFPNAATDELSLYSKICDVKHRDHHIIANQLGKKVKPVPFLGVAYMMNHINSVAQRRESRKRTVAQGAFNSMQVSLEYLRRYFCVDLSQSDNTRAALYMNLRFYAMDYYIKFRIRLLKNKSSNSTLT